ncbi:MAG: RHS repeat-associated core domain-containing protein [Flavobacteriales bacterium]
MHERSGTNGGEKYRYGFNGMESIDEMVSAENGYDFGARMYDGRLGRWWSVDRMCGEFASNTVYCFAVNSPIGFIDPDGEKIIGATEEDIITVQLAIITVFSEFSTLSSLFQIAEDGLSLQKIDPESFFNEIKKLGPENADARNVANALYHAIGSDTEYTVSFVEDAEDISGLTGDKKYKTGKDLDSAFGGGAFAIAGKKVNILLNEQSQERKNRDFFNPSSEGGFNSLNAGLQNLNTDLSIVAAIIGSMYSANDPYIQSSSNETEEKSVEITKLTFDLTMIKIENTIARCMGLWQNSGMNRFGGTASDRFSQLEGEDLRVKEFEYGWSSNPRDLNLKVNDRDYYANPSDIPQK